MTPVAEGLVLGLFAGTQIGRFGLVGGESKRRKFASLVRSVAEGLVVALSATAPIIGFSGFQGHGDRGRLSDCGSGH